MIMNEWVGMLIAAVGGIILGAFFYGGLWYTVRQGVKAKQPGRWFVVSWFLRMTVVLAGFYFIAGSSWQRMLICLLGFSGARLAVIWLTRPHVEQPCHAVKESEHAT